MTTSLKQNALLAAMIMAGMSAGASASAIQAQPEPDQSRVIIAMDNANQGLITALTKQSGGIINIEANGFIAATFPGKTLNNIKGLMNHPLITLIESDPIRTNHAYADDTTNPHTTQTRSYVITQSQSDIVTPNAGAMKKVCIIDSGIDGMHPDFNFGQIQGQDDAVSGRWDVPGGAHGTHVAGIIAADDNAIGTLGVAPGTPLHIVKVFTESGWAYSSSLAYAAQQCINSGADIINMSLGGGSPSNTEASVFSTFSKQGGLAIAAAGNSGNNTRTYPAGYNDVMMVGANDANNSIASFSQFPSCTTSGKGKTSVENDGSCVEVTAGGVRVMSAYPITDGTYGYMSGTSMATPVVAGVAANIWSHFPQCTGEQIRNALKQSAEDAGVSGKDTRFGYGIVKAASAYQYLMDNPCDAPVTTDPEPTPDPDPTPCRGKKCQ